MISYVLTNSYRYGHGLRGRRTVLLLTVIEFDSMYSSITTKYGVRSITTKYIRSIYEVTIPLVVIYKIHIYVYI